MTGADARPARGAFGQARQPATPARADSERLGAARTRAESIPAIQALRTT
ncbi:MULTISPECIES: hypothetical protein [Cupriavidus]|nr:MULTISPECIES: hypothetical protein [Cupriavidus]